MAQGVERGGKERVELSQPLGLEAQTHVGFCLGEGHVSCMYVRFWNGKERG